MRNVRQFQKFTGNWAPGRTSGETILLRTAGFPAAWWPRLAMRSAGPCCSPIWHPRRSRLRARAAPRPGARPTRTCERRLSVLLCVCVRVRPSHSPLFRAVFHTCPLAFPDILRPQVLFPVAALVWCSAHSPESGRAAPRALRRTRARRLPIKAHLASSPVGAAHRGVWCLTD